MNPQTKAQTNSQRTVTIFKGNGYPLLSRRILPNDPCTCGSGKKAKKCCGTDTKYYYSKKDPKPLNKLDDLKNNPPC